MGKKPVIKQQNNKRVQKKDEMKDVKQRLKKMASATNDPRNIVKKADDILKDIEENGMPEGERANEYTRELTKGVMMLGLDNHYQISETVESDLQPMLMQMANEVVEEYSCETASEKAMAEMVAGSYCRYLQYSKLLSKCMYQEFLSDVKTNHYKMLSKEVDRAHRQFTTALSTLRQIKAPTVNINVKAKNAFMAQNQQFNNNEDKK